MTAQPQVSIRVLPDAAPDTLGRIVQQQQSILELELSGAEAAIPPGSIVEIVTAGILYIGLVFKHQGRSLSVQIEHAADRWRIARTAQQGDSGPR